MAQYQIACMELAKEAFDRHGAAVRDPFALTLNLTREGFADLKAEIVSFRMKLRALEETVVAFFRVPCISGATLPTSLAGPCPRARLTCQSVLDELRVVHAALTVDIVKLSFQNLKPDSGLIMWPK